MARNRIAPQDEGAPRRPEWSEGFWVRLTDGGLWALPRVRYLSVDGIGSLWSVGGRDDPEFGEAFAEAVEANVTANDARGNDPEASASCRSRVAALLLARNYDLVPEAAERLVTWAEVDEDQVAFARTILEEVIARAGKIAGANGKARREPGLN